MEEFRNADRLLRESHAGEPVVVLLCGPTGVGKTELLSALLKVDSRTGATVLGASTDLESAAEPFGVARKLFASSTEVAEVTADAVADLPANAVAHRLYRAAVRLATARPLVMAVDDVHWCDEETLRWLDFLLRRADGLPVAVVLTRCPEHPGPADTLVRELMTRCRSEVVLVEPFGPDEVAHVLARRLGRTPDPAFTMACLRLSGGSPRVLDQLLASAASHHIAPDDPGAERIADVGRDIVAGSLLDHLGRQEPYVLPVARAVAVLDDVDDVDLIAALSEVSAELAAMALEQLRAADILGDGEVFQHDLVRAVILADLPPERLRHLHDRAARLLSDAGQPAERIAEQLLELPELPERWMADVLIGAAGDAQDEGAPARATRYLRAVLRAHPEDRAARFQLGSAVARVDPLAALDDLGAALAVATNPRTRADIGVRLALSYLSVRRGSDAVDLLVRTQAELAGALGTEPDAEDVETRTMVDATLALCELSVRATAERARQRLVTLAAPSGHTPAERQLLGTSALAMAMGDHSVGTAVDRARQVLLLDDSSLGGWGTLPAVLVLHLADQTDEAIDALGALITLADDQGATWTHSMALATRAVLRTEVDVTASAADARTALDIADQEQWREHTVRPLLALAAAAVLRADAQQAERLLAEAARRDPGNLAWDSHTYLHTRGRTRALLGDLDGAVADLRRCERSLAEFAVRNPVLSPWWVDAAVLLAGADRIGEAAELAEHGTELAATWSTSRSTGLALLAKGVASTGSASVELLTEAAAALANSNSDVDHAWAETLLGTALLRRGDVNPAREHLRRSVAVSTRCGARGVGYQAKQLLARAGGRMRATNGTLLDLLTTGERRAVELAAAGGTNREIADSLFVSQRAVEMHLSSAYRKLGVSGRAELITLFHQLTGRGPRPGDVPQS